MNYSNIKYNDISNGPGIRTSLFVSGCRNNCPGCFNKEAQNFDNGEYFSTDTINNIIESVKGDYHDGISILGGEPMEEENVESVLKLIRCFRSTYKDTRTIWLYSGYTLEKLVEKNNKYIDEILQQIDVLVDGPFIESLKDISLQFRGSSNQRIIDLCNLKRIVSSLEEKDSERFKFE